MAWLNYHHLLYFWTCVREGGVTRAARSLHLSQSTISGQIRALEGALGEQLFKRERRRLTLTEMGNVVFRYAEEIFGLGRELMETVRGRAPGRPARLVVGVADALPKRIAMRLLQPALDLPVPVRIVCYEERPERLLARLVTHDLDVVLTDAPMPQPTRVKAFQHLLGECGVSFLARGGLARRLRGAFPRSLDGAPFLLPAEHTAMRRGLDTWFEDTGILPRTVGEFEDSALVEAFGQHGAGVFVAPTVIEDELVRQYGVQRIGRTDAIKESFYAVSVERRLTHPAVLAITRAARRELFVR